MSGSYYGIVDKQKWLVAVRAMLHPWVHHRLTAVHTMLREQENHEGHLTNVAMELQGSIWTALRQAWGHF